MTKPDDTSMPSKTSYQVIARRFRPQLFADVVGQEHVTGVLEGAITLGRVGHAYLFCGPRGVGKTSTARILARALNCAQGPTPTPCNTCDVCRAITAGTSLDTIEIDGASNRGIDDVRELREAARYAPVGGRYKLYIIDEVHMLTAEAFNALLKTLEEPPSHVVFVFATTEPLKVPATILSRCQRFDFRRLKVGEIADQLGAIARAEKLAVEPAALAVLARRGQGSMRDAESLLDQILVATQTGEGEDKRKGKKDGRVGRETVERLLGLTPTEIYLDLSAALKRQDPAGALRLLEQALAAGGHLDELASGLVEHLRNLLLLSVSKDLAPATGLGDDVVESLLEQIDGWAGADLTRMLEIAVEAVLQMRRSDFPQLHLEMALVQMAELPAAADLKTLLDRLPGGSPTGGGGTGRVKETPAPPPARPVPARKRVPRRVEESGPAASLVPPPSRAAAAGPQPPATAGPAPPAVTPAPPAVTPAPPAVAPAPPAVTPAPPAVTPAPPAGSAAGVPRDFATRWTRVIGRIKERKAYVATILAELRHARLERDLLRLVLPGQADFHRDQLLDVRNRALVLEELRAEFGPNVRYELETAPAEPPEPRETPPAAERRAAFLDTSPGVERLIERYDGVVIKGRPDG